jgi:hypothetical protein
MRVVATGSRAADDSSPCVVDLHQPVDLASKAVVSALQFNDIVNAAEVAEPAFGNCEPGMTNCQTSIYPESRREHRRRDPSLTAMSGRLWPQSMGVKLRDVPPSGLTFSTDENNRHKAIYFRS